MNTITKFLILSLFVGLFANAQKSQNTIENLKILTNADITTNDETGLAEFVKFPVGEGMILNGATLEQKSLSFLQEYKNIYNMESVDETLLFEKIQIDNYGLANVIFKQLYKGVPVFDGQLRFHFNSDQKLTAINGNYISGISKLNPIPTLTIDQCSDIALHSVDNQGLNGSGKKLEIHSTILYVFPKGLVQGYVSSYHLVYEVEVRNDLDVREFVYVDAHTGVIIEQFTGMAHALNRKLYENNTGNLVWQEGDLYPGVLNQAQKDILQTSEHVYNYFKNAFSYISFNNADAQMRNVNNSSSIGCETRTNASWNGATANFCDSSAADDVIGHEWGHAYTQYTSGLIYQYQSGAINESYSDIWGETIDLLNNYQDSFENLAIRTSNSCSSDRWKIGEKASGFSSPIRDMWNPNCHGDPAKLTDSQYSCGEFDSGGVHINSGIPNHAYALLVDGGSYNGQIISSLGFVKTAHIFWRAQSVYLTRSSDFENLADALEAACADLVGINLKGLSTSATDAGLSGQVITVADCQNVTSALIAVELRINPDACGYMPILAESPPLCEASTSNPLYVENWESGIGEWAVSQLPTNASTWDSREWTVSSTLPNGRPGNAIFGTDPINGNCSTDLENGIIRIESPVISIPNIASGTFDMAFNHYVATERSWDGGNIKYSLNDGPWTIVPSSSFLVNPYNGVLNTVEQNNDNPMQGEPVFTGTDGGSTTSTWGQSVINLSSLGVTAMSNIQFRFELGTDGCNGNDGWYIDEIVIYNCSATLSVADANYFESGITLFPNPSKGLFTLKKLRNIDLSQAEIFDMNGRSIKTFDLTTMQNQIQIDMSHVASGIYFLKVSSNNANHVIKLIRY